VYEPPDEFRFWMQLKEDRRSPARELAKVVDQSFQDISSPGFTSLDSHDMNAVLDLVSRSFDAFNSAWMVVSDGQAFPQRRMAHLFDCVGKALCLYIQKQLSTVDIWRGRTGDVKMKLQSAVRICEAWCHVPMKLTTTFWPGAEHSWKGPAHIDSFMQAFKARLEHVLRIRTLSDELL